MSLKGLLNRNFTCRLSYRLYEPFRFLLIRLPTWPHLQERLAKNQSVTRLYEVRKNGLTFLDSEDKATTKVIWPRFYNLFPTVRNNLKVWIRDAVLKKAATLLHAKSLATAPNYVWEYVGKRPVGCATKEHGLVWKWLSKISELLRQQWWHDYNWSEWSSHSHLVF